MPTPMTEIGHSENPFPTIEQGMHAAAHFAKGLIGSEVLTPKELGNHGWVVAGVALDQVLAGNLPMQINAAALTSEERTALEQFTQTRAAGEISAIDWAKWAKIILPILLRLLVCLAVLLTLAGPSFSQGMRPAQGPALASLSVGNPSIPDGAILLSPEMGVLPGGCIWGSYDALYRESMKTGKPLIVHIGSRLDGLCHTASKDGWLHTLQQEFMGHRSGLMVLKPSQDRKDLQVAARFTNPTVSEVVAVGRQPHDGTTLIVERSTGGGRMATGAWDSSAMMSNGGSSMTHTHSATMSGGMMMARPMTMMRMPMRMAPRGRSGSC